MTPLIQYINEALKPISTNPLVTWRQKVSKPEYYHQELTGSKYIRPLIKALTGEGLTKVARKRHIEDFVEMYFGNYMSAKDGSFTLAKVKDIEYSQNSRNYQATVLAIDKWFSGMLARFTFKVHVSDPEKYFNDKNPEGNAHLTIKIDTPVYKSPKDISWTGTRVISIEVPAAIPQGDPLYLDLAKQMSAQTRDMNWGYYDPVQNKYSKED